MADEKLTAEWLEKQIRDLAQHGEGADRRWALKTLREDTGAETAFQQPLTDQEVIERLGRLMRGAGINLTRAAYVKIFGNYAATLAHKPVDTGELDVDVEDLPKTLKQYYRRYPEYKKAGYPEGYPLKDPVKQMLFIHRLSIQREKERVAAISEQAMRHITHITDPATDGSPDTP